MRKKKDPRLADISSGSNAAPDMPVAKPVEPVKKKTMQERLAERRKNQPPADVANPIPVKPLPTKPVAKSELDEDDLPPAVRRRRRMRWSNRPEWVTPLLTAAVVSLFAYLIYFGIQTFDERLSRNQRLSVFTDVWQQLLQNDVAVEGTPSTADGSDPVFPYLGFDAVNDRQAINQNLRLAATLPGVTEIRLSPPASHDAIAQAKADLSTLRIIASNYPNLTSLDLNSTSVNELEILYSLKLKTLRVVNTPIPREKLGTLALMKSVTDLHIGWTRATRNPDHKSFFTEGYRERLIDAIAELKELKNLYTLDLNLTEEEKRRLPPGVTYRTLN